jgi:hypothetical protein
MKKRYGNYPFAVVVLSLAVSWSIYALGAFVFSALHPLAAAAYLLYCAAMEIRLLRSGCVNCCYYGKTCAFGRGRIAALLFCKGAPEKFVARKITWRDMIPDLLVLLFPLAGGVAALIMRFSWSVAAAMAIMTVFSFAGNAFVRGNFACTSCMQAGLGCPAFELFGRMK